MTYAEPVNFIIAIGAAIATILSAMAANKSARLAESAEAALKQEQLRSAKREFCVLVAGCIYEHKRVTSLANKLNSVDRENAIFTATVGGSRHKLAQESIEKCLEDANQIYMNVKPFQDNTAAIHELVAEDIQRHQIELTVGLSKLRGIADELERECTSKEAQMMQYRAQDLSRT